MPMSFHDLQNYTILLYGSGVWTMATEENVKRVFNLQRRAARVVLDADFSEGVRGFLHGFTSCR